MTCCWRKEGHFIGWRTSWPQTFQPQASTIDLSTSDFSTINVSIPDFSTMNFSSPRFKNSWLKSLWLKSLGLKGQGLKSHQLSCNSEEVTIWISWIGGPLKTYNVQLLITATREKKTLKKLRLSKAHTEILAKLQKYCKRSTFFFQLNLML